MKINRFPLEFAAALALVLGVCYVVKHEPVNIPAQPIQNEIPVMTQMTQSVSTMKHGQDWQYITSWYKLDHVRVSNNELEVYTKNNVVQHNNSVTLISNSDYTSGAVIASQSFLYGKFIAVAKLPTGKGLFPAMWLRPVNTANIYPEIDWMENLGSNSDQVYCTFHYVSDKVHDHTVSVSETNYSASYHTYELDWSPSSLTWKLDGKVVSIITNNIPNQPMMLELNTAIGGGWPGSPDKTTKFPQYFSFQYVKYEFLK